MTPEECVTQLNEVVALATFIVALITAAGLLSMANLYFGAKQDARKK